MNYEEAKQNLKECSKNVKIAEISHEIASIELKITCLKEEIEKLKQEKCIVETQGLKAYLEEIKRQNNSLHAFLRSKHVNLGKNGKNENGVELYCREKDFVALFNDFCRESHYCNTKWTSQFYNGPFYDFNIRVSKNSHKRYPNKEGCESFSGTFLIGVDINK
jgi:hypothetical protein